MGGSELKAKNRRLLELLKIKLGSEIESYELSLDDPVIRIRRDNMQGFFRLLKLDSELAFNVFLNVTAVDWFDQKAKRFEVVYHLLSLAHLHRLRIKISLGEDDCELDSLTGVWPGANWMEREVFDMYGVRFRGHPDLRRVLMYDEFKGHALRKDYPLQGKQPRVPLLHAEVQNTARLMRRPELVHIGRSAETAGSGEKEAR